MRFFILPVLIGVGALLSSPVDAACLREVLFGLKELEGPTLLVSGKVPGKYGGFRYRVRPKFRWPGNWDSGLPNVDAPQGSPLALMLSLAPPVRDFFGIEFEGSSWVKIRVNGTSSFSAPHLAVVPDRVEFEGAVAAYNQLRNLNDDGRILIHFYPSDGRASEHAYLERWAREGMLPWAELGSEFHHDFNYHVGSALMLPNVLTQWSRRQVRGWLDFVADFEAREPTAFWILKESGVMATLERPLVRAVDFGTGSLPQVLSADGAVVRSRRPDFILERMRILVDGGASVEEVLRARPLDIRVDSDNDSASLLLVQRCLFALQHRLEQYIERHKNDPGFTERLTQVGSDTWVERRIEERAQSVLRNVEKLRAKDARTKKK